MSEIKTKTNCNSEALLGFVMNQLSQSEAELIRQHLLNCPECSEEKAQFEMLRNGMDEFKDVKLTETDSQEIWNILQNEAGKAADRVSLRNAWHILWKPRLLPIIATSAFLFLMIIVAVGAKLLPSQSSKIAIAGTSMELKPEEQRQIEFNVGADVTIEPASRIAIDAADRDSGRIYLANGKISVRVNKLKNDQHFEVRTDDAVIAVKGTRFEVIKSMPDMTDVVVTEGTVWVTPAGKNRDKIILKAGQSVSVPGEITYLGELRKSGEKALLSETTVEDAVVFFERYILTDGSNSNIEVKFLLADAFEQLGDIGKAIKIYNDIIIESSDNLKAENAFASLASAHKRLGHKEKEMETWKSYIERFPKGVYSQEALNILTWSDNSKTR